MAADRDRWLLPRLARTRGPLGLTMPEPLLRHQLVPNDPVLRGSCFMDELPTSARIVAVEGYPRNSRQCADLVDELRRRCCELVGLVVIDIPDDGVHKRVANRRLCSVRERCRGAWAVPDRPFFSPFRVDADHYLSAGGQPGDVRERLGLAVVGRLLRHGEPLGSGAAVLSNFIRFFTFEETRDFHVAHFRAVWAAFSLSTGIAAEPGSFRFKTGIIGDGAGVSIPPSTNRSSCARRAKPGSEWPERASFCG